MPSHDSLLDAQVAFVLFKDKVYMTHPTDRNVDLPSLLETMQAMHYITPEDYAGITNYLSTGAPYPGLELTGRYLMTTGKLAPYGPNSTPENVERVKQELAMAAHGQEGAQQLRQEMYQNAPDWAKQMQGFPAQQALTNYSANDVLMVGDRVRIKGELSRDRFSPTPVWAIPQLIHQIGKIQSRTRLLSVMMLTGELAGAPFLIDPKFVERIDEMPLFGEHPGTFTVGDTWQNTRVTRVERVYQVGEEVEVKKPHMAPMKGVIIVARPMESGKSMGLADDPYYQMYQVEIHEGVGAGNAIYCTPEEIYPLPDRLFTASQNGRNGAWEPLWREADRDMGHWVTRSVRNARVLTQVADKVGRGTCPICLHPHEKTLYHPKDRNLARYLQVEGHGLCRDCLTTVFDNAEQALGYKIANIRRARWSESADVSQLAEQARERIDINFLPGGPWEKWGEENSGYYNMSKKDVASRIIMQLPDEAYKLYEWVCLQVKNGTLGFYQMYSAFRTIEDFAKVLNYFKERNKPWPDIKSKKFDYHAMEDWLENQGEAFKEIEGENGPYEYPDDTVYNFGNGWRIVQLNPDNAETEGSLMQNCIKDCDTYHWDDKIRDGHSYIFSLRDPRNQPHVSIEADGRAWDGDSLTVYQEYGRNNAKPVEKYQAYIDTWKQELKKNGIHVNEEPDYRPDPYENEDREPEHNENMDEMYYGDPIEVNNLEELEHFWNELQTDQRRFGWYPYPEDQTDVDDDNEYGNIYYGGREMMTAPGDLYSLVDEFLKDEMSDIDPDTGEDREDYKNNPMYEMEDWQGWIKSKLVEFMQSITVLTVMATKYHAGQGYGQVMTELAQTCLDHINEWKKDPIKNWYRIEVAQWMQQYFEQESKVETKALAVPESDVEWYHTVDYSREVQLPDLPTLTYKPNQGTQPATVIPPAGTATQQTVMEDGKPTDAVSPWTLQTQQPTRAEELFSPEAFQHYKDWAQRELDAPVYNNGVLVPVPARINILKEKLKRYQGLTDQQAETIVAQLRYHPISAFGDPMPSWQNETWTDPGALPSGTPVKISYPPSERKHIWRGEELEGMEGQVLNHDLKRNQVTIMVPELFVNPGDGVLSLNREHLYPIEDRLFQAKTAAGLEIPAEYTDTDPYDIAGKQPVFNAMQIQWWNLPPDLQRKVIVNAFRATMISPRLKLRDNAITYQALMQIDPQESDPDVFENVVRQYKEKFDTTDRYVQPGVVLDKLIPGFWGNIRKLANLGPYAESLRQAALADLDTGDGSGVTFRNLVTKMGIPGIGPKILSFAWLTLMPTKSELATIDVHMMQHFYPDVPPDQVPDAPKNNSHYYQLEHQLRRERDDVYGPEVPLGQYQWAVWDKRRTPGFHQDHSPLRPYMPTPYQDVEWPKPVPSTKRPSDQGVLF